jgi:hypothetical protein
MPGADDDRGDLFDGPALLTSEADAQTNKHVTRLASLSILFCPPPAGRSPAGAQFN